MPNSYFQFKKFIVLQEKCALKVCTDSCLFGAWVANEIGNRGFVPKNILDIGTGTGLLSLMLAQKTVAQIDAVELDINAFSQASENVKNSSWPDQIMAFHSDIKLFKPRHKYDLIISNPPFFQNDLLSKNNEKNASKHDSTLMLEDLINLVKNLLTDEGKFAVLLPWQRAEGFEKSASLISLYAESKVEVKQTPAHNYFRTMFIFEKKNTFSEKKSLTIKDSDNAYSKEFAALLKDYYLYL